MNVGVLPSATTSAHAAQVGWSAPPFDLECFDGESGKRGRARLADYQGRWLVLLFCPRETIFGCAAEIASFSAGMDDFRRRDCEILAVGHEPVPAYQKHFDDPTRTAAARRRFEELFTPFAVAGRFAALYEEVLGTSRWTRRSAT